MYLELVGSEVQYGVHITVFGRMEGSIKWQLHTSALKVILRAFSPAVTGLIFVLILFLSGVAAKKGTPASIIVWLLGAAGIVLLIIGIIDLVRKRRK